MATSGLHKLLLAVSMATILLQLTNSADISESPTDQSGSPAPANPGCDLGVFPGTESNAAINLESNDGTPENVERCSTGNRRSWLRSCGQSCSSPLRRIFNRLFSRPTSKDRESAVRPSFVCAVRPILYLYYKFLQTDVAIGVNNGVSAVSGQADRLLKLFLIFLWKLKEHLPEFMVVTAALSRLEIFPFLLYLLFSTFMAALQVLWTYRGTLACLMVAAPGVIYSIDSVKNDNLLPAVIPQQYEGAESANQDESKRAVHSIGEPSSDSVQQQDRNDDGEASSSFWVWISAVIVIVVVAIASTSYFVYKRKHWRRSDDVAV